jgi:sterol desaturase/sphingolipid hydroxylase (fatty acid hydroxylase superfamily)
MLDNALRTVSDAFGVVQQALFEAVIQPLMFLLGLGSLLEEGFTATGWLVVGLFQLLVMVALIGDLERWRPVEPVLDKAAVRTDMVYTLVHRLGLFRLALFFGIEPLWDLLFGQLSSAGVPSWQLDVWIAPWWPGVTDTAWLAFVVYLLAFDFVDYWVHRGQHSLRWWWSLHALHHSQRQMTMWSDSRNHLLDDLLRDAVIVLAARGIGVAPEQFIAIVACTQLLENLAHANFRAGFGRVFERVLVSPRFHRVHHSIGVGHESFGPGTLGGCNFAVLFPVWDVLFRTADFGDRFEPTGVRDQLPDHGGRDYGRGFWQQQVLGLKRLGAALGLSSAP